MLSQLDIENHNLSLAGVDFTILAESGNLVGTSIVQSFGSSLHDIGKDIAAGGPAQFIAAISDTTTQSGQAVIATMREGRNLAVLENAGVRTDTQIPATGR